MTRIDGPEKVTGRAEYAGDMRARIGTDVAVTVTVARGRCPLAVDETAVRSVPGVRHVITYMEAPRLGTANAISGSELSKPPLLQDDRVA